MDWRYLVLVFHGLGFSISAPVSKHLCCSKCSDNLLNQTTTQLAISCELTTLVCECAATSSCKLANTSQGVIPLANATKGVFPICNASKYYNPEKVMDQWLDQCKKLGCELIQAGVEGDPSNKIMISHIRLFPGIYPAINSDRFSYIRNKTTPEDFCKQFGMRKAGYTLAYNIPGQVTTKTDRKTTTVKSTTTARNLTVDPGKKVPLRPCNCRRSLKTSRLSRGKSKFRIVGGQEAPLYSYPWIVSLQNLSRHRVCAGSLIRVGEDNEKSNVVLTAAHCVAEDEREKRVLSVKAGSNAFRQTTWYAEQVKVKKIIIHPKVYFYADDIAILLLESPILFSKVIQGVCLPAQDAEIPENSIAKVAGWGQLYEKGPNPENLMEVALPVVNVERCRRGGIVFTRRESFVLVCAGVAGKDTCQGDSGGPLTVETACGPVLYGITNFGIGCGRERKPGIYTRVAKHINWINDQISGQL